MIIGICGKKGHGKSTLATLLEVHYDAVRLPMAAPIKEMGKILGLSGAQLYGDYKEVPDPRFDNKSARYIMQTLGTEWGRQMICEDIWVNAWENLVSLDCYHNRTIICDDVRFPNEVEKIQSLGGILIAVEREEEGNSFVGHDHISEQLDFKAYGIPILINDSTREELLKKALCHLY